MKNILVVKNDSYSNITQETEGSGIDVFYSDVASADGVELFQGDSYAETLAVESYESGILATIPAEYLTGSILHFRVADGDDRGNFLHIVYSKNGEPFFVGYNDKVVGNVLLKV